MAEYKVLADTEVSGTLRSAGDVVDLSEEAAASLVSEGKLEAVAGQGAGSNTTAAPTVPADQAGSTNVAAAPEGEAAKAPRLVTEEDIAANPIPAELGAAIGDVITLSK